MGIVVVFETAGDAYRWAMQEREAFLCARTVDFEKIGGCRVKSRPLDHECIAINIMGIIMAVDVELRYEGSALMYHYMHPPMEYKKPLSPYEEKILERCEDDFVRALKDCGYL